MPAAGILSSSVSRNGPPLVGETSRSVNNRRPARIAVDESTPTRQLRSVPVALLQTGLGVDAASATRCPDPALACAWQPASAAGTEPSARLNVWPNWPVRRQRLRARNRSQPELRKIGHRRQVSVSNGDVQMPCRDAGPCKSRAGRRQKSSTRHSNTYSEHDTHL